MYGDLGGRQLEDQPATAGVNPGKSEHVADEDPVSLRVAAVENDMCTINHVPSSLLLYSATPCAGSSRLGQRGRCSSPTGTCPTMAVEQCASSFTQGSVLWMSLPQPALAV